MRKLISNSMLAAAACAVLSVVPATGQAPAYKAPRPDRHPTLTGIVQAMNTANWDNVSHASTKGQLWQNGAAGAHPPGIGIVEGDQIPYLPAALAKKKENNANRLALDPETKCYMPGVPRANYMPYPFQIVQSPKVVMISYQFAGAVRTINMDSKKESPADSWMGWSNGHWEGETLVVDVTGQNDQTWFDRAGDFHSEKLHVVERYTPRSADTLMYEATLEDPDTFSRPWKISMPLYRHVEKNAVLLEYRCVEYSEELLYGHL